jgi:calpain-15
MFPVINGNCAFSKGNGTEIWVMLIEKAYAKMYGNYEVIEGGNPAHAMFDLTGAPTVCLFEADEK